MRSNLPCLSRVRQYFSTPGRGRPIDGIIQVYGLEIARNMLEVKGRDGWAEGTVNASVLVTGMVGAPAISRSSRDYLSFFVNGRWVNSRLLAWAVEEAYHGLLMTGRHPVAIIHISLAAKEVDVNVHPTKSEVKFQRERLVIGTVQKAVRRTLLELAPVPKIEEAFLTYPAPAKSNQTLPILAKIEAPSRGLATLSTPAFSLPALRLLGQLANTYLVAEGPDGLYLLDQHAAHERILFEKIKHQLSQQKVGVQGLLEPVTFEVSPQENEALKSHDEHLAEFGFSLEPFGERTYLVRTVPALLHQKDWAGALRELLATPDTGDRDDWREKIATSLACHSAVRAGQILSDGEMRELLRQLEQVAVPNTCPHGRPTMIHLSSGQLEKEFGRS